jgi:CRP/FNR family transcriptional regulator
MRAERPDRLSQYLLALPYFENADSSTVAALERQAVYRAFSADQIIFNEGEPAAGMWLLEQGRVKIFKLNPEGEEHILHFVGEGNTFNDIAAFDSGNNPANAAALTDISLWLIPTAVLHHVLATNPQLALRVIRLLAGRVRGLVHQIEDLALYSVSIRLARFLLKQAEDPALSGPGVTRAAIAAHLATTPESVSRSLKTLEETGAIRFDRHRIIIEREDLLRTIAAL